VASVSCPILIILVERALDRAFGINLKNFNDKKAAHWCETWLSVKYQASGVILLAGKALKFHS